jgi:glutamine---fructose-6-phosphate transaminase (isomerizing)
MCGIVGYVGNGRCKKFILEGLSRLEYRGYDSAGFVCIDEKHSHFSFAKEVGNVSKLRERLEGSKSDGSVGMGHTRWATHGIADQANAHPHFNCRKTVAVVHNGIVETYQEIREKLINSGHDFYSTTDTEVVAHLFGLLVSNYNSLKDALIDLVDRFTGAFSFVFMLEEHPDKLILVRRRSPLSVGVGKEEMFVASDPLAFSDKTNKVLFMPDESFAILTKDDIELYDFDGKALMVNTQSLDVEFSKVEKKGFDHYMLKEIYEQKRAIDRTISFCKLIGSNLEISDLDSAHKYQINEEYHDRIWQQLGLSLDQVENLKSVNLVAAGTSWHASRIAQFFFEYVCKIPTRVHLASEFRYMQFFAEEDSIFIFISQSGETADTLEALRLVNSFKIPTIVITNVASSTMVREAGGFLPMQAGPEIAVASTKAFSTQIAILYWFANRIAMQKGFIFAEEMKQAEEDLFVAAEVLEATIESYKWDITQSLAEKYAKYDKFIFLGRHVSYPFALEAALKLKEISYIFAQCYSAGELKHGPIALIDEHTPAVIFSCIDNLLYQKLIGNAQEIKARKGHLITFAFENQKELIAISDYAFVLPRVKPLLAPLAMTGLMQFFTYEITKFLGRPIDKPRNLAKSVTVE